MAAIRADNITFSYEGAKSPSLTEVCAEVKEGVKTALLGANGAGKSTLFYHFNGVVKPSSGCVYVMDEPISYRKKGLRRVRTKVAVVLQNPDDQVFGQTVEADVAYGPHNLKLPEEEVRRRVDRALFQTGLEALRERNTLHLSYGQRKRLALASALAMEPEVLVMDEPTAGLDPQMAFDLMELADQLHHSGTTIILSTHDVDLAYSWADEIMVLRKSRMIYSGKPVLNYSVISARYLAGWEVQNVSAAAVCGVNSLFEQSALHANLVYGNYHRFETVYVGQEIIAQKHHVSFLADDR